MGVATYAWAARSPGQPQRPSTGGLAPASNSTTGTRSRLTLSCLAPDESHASPTRAGQCRVDLTGGRVRVDPRCRLAEGIWAVGDATGQAMFAPVAKYQARVVADTMLGTPRSARYEGLPRVVFADPEIAPWG